MENSISTITNWIITENPIHIGVSIQGKDHISVNPQMPCQDAFEKSNLGNGWHINILSDGAGSSINSHLGSGFVTRNLSGLFKEFITANKWIENKFWPDEEQWKNISMYLFNQIKDGLIKYAESNNYEIKSLHCTLIFVLKSPYGILCAHVGDGRGGYLSQGKYMPIFKPFKGEMVGTTVFITNDYWIEYFESIIISNKAIDAFFITTDGCENFSFLTTQFDETSKMFFDANLPFPGFYDNLIELIKKESQNNSIENITEKLYNLIDTGILNGIEIKAIQNERDDKSMILWIR